MKDKIIEGLAENSGLDKSEISGESRLIGDLGLSSFDVANIAVQIEEDYGMHIPDERFPEMETVDDVVRIVEEVK